MRLISKGSFVSLFAITLISASACVQDASQSAGGMDDQVPSESSGQATPIRCDAPTESTPFTVYNSNNSQPVAFEIFQGGTSIAQGSVAAWSRKEVSVPVMSGSVVHVTVKETEFGTVAFDQDMAMQCNGFTTVWLDPTVQISAAVETEGNGTFAGAGAPTNDL